MLELLERRVFAQHVLLAEDSTKKTCHPLGTEQLPTQ